LRSMMWGYRVIGSDGIPLPDEAGALL
jgi:hypothetical protein